MTFMVRLGLRLHSKDCMSQEFRCASRSLLSTKKRKEQHGGGGHRGSSEAQTMQGELEKSLSSLSNQP